MSRSRKSEASRVLAFFRDAKMEVAATVLGLAQEVVKGRQPPALPSKVRKSHRKKVDGTETGENPGLDALAAAGMERARQRKAKREVLAASEIAHNAGLDTEVGIRDRG